MNFIIFWLSACKRCLFHAFFSIIPLYLKTNKKSKKNKLKQKNSQVGYLCQKNWLPQMPSCTWMLVEDMLRTTFLLTFATGGMTWAQTTRPCAVSFYDLPLGHHDTDSQSRCLYWWDLLGTRPPSECQGERALEDKKEVQAAATATYRGRRKESWSSLILFHSQCNGLWNMWDVHKEPFAVRGHDGFLTTTFLGGALFSYILRRATSLKSWGIRNWTFFGPLASSVMAEAPWRARWASERTPDRRPPCGNKTEHGRQPWHLQPLDGQVRRRDVSFLWKWMTWMSRFDLGDWSFTPLWPNKIDWCDGTFLAVCAAGPYLHT